MRSISRSPWENGYVEIFNGKLRDELLDREVSYTLVEVRVLTEQYRQTYNRIRPHSSTGHRPPKHSCTRTLSRRWRDSHSKWHNHWRQVKGG